MMKFRTPALAAVLVGGVFLTAAERAEARRGLPILTTGDKFFAEQSLPKDLKDQVPEATKMGFHCQHFGVLWLPLWTWDGHWCVYNDEAHENLPDEIAADALGKKGDKPGKPLLYRVPLGLLVIGVGLGIWIMVAKAGGNSDAGETYEPEEETPAPQ